MKKVALVLGLVGALAVACGMPSFALLGFAVMLASSVIWVVVMAKTEREVALLNAAFGVINVVGIVNAL